MKNYIYWLLGLFILVAILFRFWAVNGNKIIFLFDPTRDAYLSEQIFINHKLKIQGPSASGTGDKVFHGVLYYYLIGPAYSISHGDPMPVMLELIIINVLTIIPMFLLARGLTKNSSMASFLSVALFTFSFILTEFSTVLSNQIYSLPASTLFYYALWKSFFENKPRWLLITALSLGLAVQSGIYMLYLFAALILAFLISRQYEYSENILKKKRILFFSIMIFILTISSIIASELILFHRGIVHLNDLMNLSDTSNDILKSLQIISEGFINNLAMSILPTKLLLSFVIGISLIIFAVKKISSKSKLFLLIVFLSPLLLLLQQVRNNQPYIVSITPFIYILIAYALVSMRQFRYGSKIAALICIVILSANIYSVVQARQRDYNYFGIQQGGLLQDQMNAIDYTYKTAKGKPFTISTLTNPYGYNTTWAYLYDWYGKQKYGYTPDFYGPSQIGIYAGELLHESPKPYDIHFAIYEPPIGIDSYFINQFKTNQNIFTSTSSAIVNFNQIIVEKR